MDITQLNPRERLALCLYRARKFMASRRAEAPEGFDPQMSWVMAAVAVGTAVYGGVQANKASKDAKSQAAASAKANQLPEWNPPDRPGFLPLDVPGLLQSSIKGDEEAFLRSDVDFKRRHGKTVEAEGLFEDSMLQDQRGEHELSPQLQSEMMRAGLGDALAAFGDTPGTLAPGSAGEAKVARNLGLGVMQFQDRNRANRQKSLMMAEEIFPRRAIGMGGADLVGMEVTNNTGENNFNQANFSDQIQAYGNNYQVGAQNRATNQQAVNSAAAADAQAKAAQTAALTQAITGMARAYGTSQANTAPMSYAATPRVVTPTVPGATYTHSAAGGFKLNPV